ncbi:phosphotransferase [Paenibacillus methanolicus]|uniref:Phosphotransferase family enzyme n=1 Tax=Paenibacillus methanolicus TaxID=582686 RepID=A0A5S5BV27_9BACL|nr:phosphotransferase [Paenibacillus methanolicus]TYP70166.1 phosphotransferase family enzyme [Paenibacillus methanolicus]
MRQSDFKQRTTIYVGLGNRRIERVIGADGARYILKPEGGDGRERDIYDRMLAAFPPIYPKLVNRWTDDADEGVTWLLFEDLGELMHPHDPALAEEAARRMAWWHSLADRPIDPVPLRGQKPLVSEMAAEVEEKQPLLKAFLLERGMAEAGIDDALRIAGGWRPSDETLVFSHGDLHVGNYARVRGELYILDWEHAHWNYRAWDLYHLIDLSHPLYPRPSGLNWREQLLDAYADAAARLGQALDASALRADYYAAAVVFSLWMLGLIQRDLASGGGPWERTKLLAQLDETLGALAANTASAREVGVRG